VGFARADSITTSDGLTTHGRLLRLDENLVVIQSRFATETKEVTKELSIPRDSVLRIEFNATTFNPGGAPSIGLRPGEGVKTAVNPSVGSDVVVLRGGERRQCARATIDEGKVRCGKEYFDRSSLIRLELARR